MTSAANQDAYGSRGWNQGPWGNTQGPQWQQPNNGPPWGDQGLGQPSLGRPAFLASGGPQPPRRHRLHRPRLHLLVADRTGFTHLPDREWTYGMLRPSPSRDVSAKRTGCRACGRNWKSWACAPSGRPAASSGNHAFDEYKAETLRRMEEEQKDFGAFLERLRFAKDKSEFDQFMAERRNRPPDSAGGGAALGLIRLKVALSGPVYQLPDASCPHTGGLAHRLRLDHPMPHGRAIKPRQHPGHAARSNCSSG